ncbi:MAG: MFS transporter [Christensenellales bacterium]
MRAGRENTCGYTVFEYSRFREYAWKMLLSFGLTYLFLYNGRQNINLVMTQMAEGLGSTTSAMGMVSSALFWCYAFGQLVNGSLGAHLGHKRSIMLGVAASVLINVVISFQHSIPVIAVLWGLNGFCQSMVWPNGVGVLNRWWPKKERGFATGLATAFSGLAQIVTYLSVLLCMDMNPEWGWRAAFRYPVVPLGLMLAVFAVFFKTKPEDIGLEPFEEEDREAAARDAALSAEIKRKGYLYPYKVFFSEPKVLAFCLISAIAGVGCYGLLTWVPTYFTESMGLSIKEGIFSAILLPVGQACAMFVFPLITDKVFRGRREPMMALAAVVTFLGMITFPLIRTQPLASMMLFFVGVSGMVTGVVWAVAGDIGGRAFSSTVAGVFDWAVYMGAALQASVFGFVKDTFGWPAVFVTIGCLYIVMLALTLAAGKMKMKKL